MNEELFDFLDSQVDDALYQNRKFDRWFSAVKKAVKLWNEETGEKLHRDDTAMDFFIHKSESAPKA